MLKNPLLIAMLILGFVLDSIFLRAAAAARTPQNEDEPVHMVVDYPDGKKKVRESHHGLVDPVAIPVGLQVSITLRFLPALAGSVALVSSLDGGELTLPAAPTIAGDGTFVFQFRPGNVPGSYRLLINGVRQYELSIYSYDPSNPPGRRPRH